jgi:hypothetical protein
MIGIAAPDNRLRRFEEAISQGQLLLMVNVTRSRVAEIVWLPLVAHASWHAYRDLTQRI